MRLRTLIPVFAVQIHIEDRGSGSSTTFKQAHEKGPFGFPVLGSSSKHAQYPLWTTEMMRYFLKLPQGIYNMSANSKGSGETALMRRLA